MKFGFSTLTCPDWDWGEIIAAASDLGFGGIELRGIQNDIYLPNIQIFGDNEIQNVISDLKRLNLRVPCLAAGAVICGRPASDAARREIAEYITLASKLGADYVRVLADKGPAPGHVDEKAVEENLRELLPVAESENVMLLVETNGVFAESARLASLIERVSSPFLGALWDIHHPYSYFNESPEKTYGNLKKYIRHVHVKDSVMVNGRPRYMMLGLGNVPAAEALKLLAADNFGGFAVLEWVRRWDMSLEAPGIALPQFLSYIHSVMK